MVHHLDGHDVEVAYLKGLVLVDFVQLDGWDAGIAVLCKAVGQHLEHALAGYWVGIDVDFAKLTVGSDIVHTTHVVVMGVRDEDAVDATEGLRHDLLAEVGPAVDEQSCLLRLQQCRTAQALVVGIGAGARPTATAYRRHATRCSCS